MKKAKLLQLFGLATAVAVAAFFAGQIYSADSTARPSGDSAQTFPLRSDGSSIFADVAEKIGPAVVFIRTERTWSQSEDNKRNQTPFDFFRDFFPDQEQRRERRIPGGGSGFVFDSDGRILTNYHVVKDAEEITVVMETAEGESEFEAEIVGTDPRSDIAVIQIRPPKGLELVPFGDSDALRVGDWVMAIGTPFGQLQGTVTVGIVSAKGRNDLNIVGGEADYQNYIQTDASINFGNSGGPLVNIRGEAVGINTAINPSGQGIGFAIPINMARNVVTQLIEKGSVRYGFIGITLLQLDKTLAEGLNLEIDHGILVETVANGFPADKAGIERRDVIIEYDGEPVRDSAKFRLMVANTPVDKKVPLVVWRDGKTKKLTITIGERPEDHVVATAMRPDSDAWLGLHVDDVGTSEVQRRFGGKRGDSGVIVLSVEEGSAADDAGIREGDVITEVYSQSVSDLDDYLDIAEKLKEREAPIAFLVKRGRSTTYIPVKPGKR